MYVHIPFCEQICSFCAFHRTVSSSEKIERYMNPLQKHFDSVLPQIGRGEITSIYFGGGTPGLLTLEQAGRVLNSIRNQADTSGARITFELHPKNATEEHVLGLMSLGVSRISIGIQNLTDSERQNLDRTITSSQEEVVILQNLNRIGVPYNIDLMFGTPGQSQKSLDDTLVKITEEVSPPEITLFQYVNAYGAKTRVLINRGLLQRPGIKDRHQMYSMARDHLTTHGYRQTGTYGFSKEKSASQRRLMNNGMDFMGLGPRVYSRVGNVFAINSATVNDFSNLTGTTENYYGLKVPTNLERAVTLFFSVLANRKDFQNGNVLKMFQPWQSEGITQIYGILYYLLNQKNLSRTS